jgi:hypothetical protein
MSETEEQEPETCEYELAEGIDRVHRHGLVLEAGETVELEPHEAGEYEDVLVEAEE